MYDHIWPSHWLCVFANSRSPSTQANTPRVAVGLVNICIHFICARFAQKMFLTFAVSEF